VAAKETILSAAGYGERRVHAIKITHGMTIVSNEQSARSHRVFYPWKRTSSSFEMVIHHSSVAAYRDFNEWMRGYIERASDPNNARVRVMRIICPAVRFDRFAIPETGLSFGTTWEAFERQQTIGWVGASSPVDASAPLGVLSASYLPTYHEQDGQVGDYQSSTAIARLYDAVTARGGEAFMDALYRPPPISPLVAGPSPEPPRRPATNAPH
jgi:hypothetical protein